MGILRNKRKQAFAKEICAVLFAMVLPVTILNGEGTLKVEQGWPKGKTYDLKGIKVTLSAPVLVGRSKEYFWYPQIKRLPNGDLVAIIRLGGDTVTADDAVAMWSRDGGLTWSSPRRFAGQSWSQLFLPSGDLLLLPFHLYRRPDYTNREYVAGVATLIPRGRSEIRQIKDGAKVTGWPRPEGATYRGDPEAERRLGLSSFCFDGQPLRLKDGRYLTTLYGTFEGPKRFSIVTAESEDGLNWKVRSTIADENCKLEGREGPGETTLCRLKDGPLMCVFRRNGGGSGISAFLPYGQTWSQDEGKTWSEPIAMTDARSVEPRHLVLEDGTVVLSGGRPGLHLWFNIDGTGKAWQSIDTLKHHNAYQPKEPIQPMERNDVDVDVEHGKYYASRTSAYTEVIVLDDTNLVYIYDRWASTFPDPPKQAQDAAQSFSIWVVRIALKRN